MLVSPNRTPYIQYLQGNPEKISQQIINFTPKEYEQILKVRTLFCEISDEIWVTFLLNCLVSTHCSLV